MKKVLLFMMMIVLLGACTSTKEDGVADRMSRTNVEEEWWQGAGDPDSEYWWVNGYDDYDDNNE